MNDKILLSYHDTYRYGAISAIIRCILSLLHLIEWHWFFILTVFYAFGMAVWFVKFMLQDKRIDQHLELADSQYATQNIETSQPRLEEKKVKSITINMEPQHQRLFQDYQQLQQRSIPFLNVTSLQYMGEIQKIMQFIQQKLDQQNNDHFKFEIMDIERTLNAYLMPALQHFSDLPPFLRERKIIDQQSPSQLLEQQLAMILEEFKNIAESIYLNDLNKLIDHGQYLKYKLTQQDSFNLSLSSVDEPK